MSARSSRRGLAKTLLPLAVTSLVGAAILVPTFGSGSSHREAPGILEDPTADNTDVYFFRSPDRPDTATIVANWIPLEEPHAGPNYYLFSDNARYNLNVDKNGDGKWDTRYSYRFTTTDTPADAAGYLYVGPDGKLLVNQTYDLVRHSRDARGKVTSEKIGAGLPTAPNNPGPKSLPNYTALFDGASQSVQGGIRTFAGNTDDPFFVDLGTTFDLVNLDKPGRTNIGFGNQGGGVDSLARYNVHSVALQVPIAQLKGASDVVGVWASTDRPYTKVVVTKGDHTKKGKKSKTKVKTMTQWRQVSRLGNPLINEVVIPRYLKDRWNGEEPATDAKYDKYYTSPFVGAALNALFPTLNLNIPTTGRADISGALLNGLDLTGLGLANNSTGAVKADMLRLNLSTPVNPTPKPLGALQGDPQGFPNGRRLTDDVVDIELRVIGGALFSPANKLPLGDGVNANDKAFSATFPYLPQPHDGFTTNPPHYRTEPAAPAVGPLP